MRENIKKKEIEEEKEKIEENIKKFNKMSWK